jgi:NADPH-dependent 2,4-dienoyl-CoA reductase/sulfur reductase-like enzyme
MKLDLSQNELRSRSTPWIAPRFHGIRPRQKRFRCDVLVIGAGITGALVAERLTRDGRNVTIVDRELPGQGSTAAIAGGFIATIL